MKIGLITQHCLRNYGSDLQAYALYSQLAALGGEVEIVDYWPPGLLAFYTQKYARLWGRPWCRLPNRLIYNLTVLAHSRQFDRALARFAEFRQSWKFGTPRYLSDEAVMANPPKADIFVTGSDAIWHPRFISPTRCLYFAKDMGARTVSYAPSIGVTHIDGEEDRQRYRQWLGHMDCLSCRERPGSLLLEKILERPVHTVLDPVFLHEAAWWRSKVDSEPLIKGDYTLAYVVHPRPNVCEIVRRLRARLGCPLVLLTGELKGIYLVPHDRTVLSAGPLEFLNLILHAKHVIASSFHGLAFSLMFQKNCWAINAKEDDSRMWDLLERAGVSGRLLRNIPDAEASFAEIDYSPVSKRLELEAEKSRDYLKMSVLGTS